jgi:hypothetical protein
MIFLAAVCGVPCSPPPLSMSPILLVGGDRSALDDAGKTTLLGEFIELHEEPWIYPYLACQLLEV